MAVRIKTKIVCKKAKTYEAHDKKYCRVEYNVKISGLPLNEGERISGYGFPTLLKEGSHKQIGTTGKISNSDGTMRRTPFHWFHDPDMFRRYCDVDFSFNESYDVTSNLVETARLALMQLGEALSAPQYNNIPGDDFDWFDFENLCFGESSGIITSKQTFELYTTRIEPLCNDSKNLKLMWLIREFEETVRDGLELDGYEVKVCEPELWHQVF